MNTHTKQFFIFKQNLIQWNKNMKNKISQKITDQVYHLMKFLQSTKSFK